MSPDAPIPHAWRRRLLSPFRRLGRLAEALASPSVERERAEMLSLVVVVCLTLFAIKAVIAYRDLDSPALAPRVYGDGLAGSLGRVVVCCREDLAVGAGCLLAVCLALGRTPSPRGRLGWRLLAYLAAAGAVVFMLVNAHLFHILQRYLTYSLFRLGGGVVPDRMILSYASLPFRLALALVPLAALGLHLWWGRAFRPFWERAARHLVRARVLGPVAAALSALALFPADRLLLGAHASDYPRNPHLLFARSLFWGSATLAGGEYAEADVEDLLPGHPGHTPGLLPRPPRNLIFIVLESVNAKSLQPYGCQLPTTPCLQRLADRGLVFENFYATVNHTIASALPILGGMYNDPSLLSTVIDHPDFPTPHASSWLRKRGYRTYFLGSGGRYALEEYRNLVPAFFTGVHDVERDPGHPFWQGSATPGAPLTDAYLDAEMFADARRAVRAEREGKFALFLWTYETHAPYYGGPGPREWATEHFPPACRGDAEREADYARYLRTIWRTDRLIGELVEEVERQGLADETLIVITGDHGEGFGEHGTFGHNHSVYEEEIRVPLILICPPVAERLGNRSEVVGGHVDLWATITDLCELPADPRWQGRSLVSGGGEDRRTYFYRHSHAVGVREGSLKYWWNFRTSEHELYDLEADPGEKVNLASERREACVALHRRVAAWSSYQLRLTEERLAGR